MAEERGFLSRWSQRKSLATQGLKPPEPVAVPAVAPEAAPAQPVEPPALAEPAAPPPPTLEEALALKPDSASFSRFVARDVDPQVKHQALKTLFSDPHFNVMDGLDVYIDDYNTPDPLPSGMLRKLVQSSALGLFDDEKPAPEPAETPAAPAPSPDNATALNPEALPDEDPAVRLQPDDDAGPAGDQPGAGEGIERQH